MTCRKQSVWTIQPAGSRRAYWLLALGLLCCTSVPSAHAESKEEPEPPVEVGFKLGTFHIKEYQPLEDVTNKMYFTVHASVLEENQDEFARLQERLDGRIRGEVLVATRLAAPAEMQDPELRLLRRRILLRLKHALPELPVKQIFISEFQLYHDT